MKTATLALALALIACGCTTRRTEEGPGGDGSAKGSSSATSTAPAPAASSVAPPPGPTAAPPSEPAAPPTPEELETINDGCTYRKSTNAISACREQSTTVGAWKPTKAEIAPVLKLGAGLCYCAKPVEKPVLTCMDSAKAPLVSVTIGALGDPTDCTVHLASAEFGGRRWVRMLADNRDRATFYQVEVIAEITSTGPVISYEGFEPLTDEMARKGETGVSPTLRAEWAALPADAKVWLTTR